MSVDVVIEQSHAANGLFNLCQQHCRNKVVFSEMMSMMFLAPLPNLIMLCSRCQNPTASIPMEPAFYHCTVLIAMQMELQQFRESPRVICVLRTVGWPWCNVAAWQSCCQRSAGHWDPFATLLLPRRSWHQPPPCLPLVQRSAHLWRQRI